MQPVYQFMIWFICSLIGIFSLISLIYNPFVISFIIALVLSLVAMENKK